jgi:hypothetical protein
MSEYPIRLSGIVHLMCYKHRDEFKSRRIRANLATAMNIDAAGKSIKKTITREVNNLHFRNLAQTFSTLRRWNYGQIR